MTATTLQGKYCTVVGRLVRVPNAALHLTSPHRTELEGLSVSHDTRRQSTEASKTRMNE